MITVVPGVAVFAWPIVLMVATFVSDEVQLTWPVRLIRLPSLNVPIAVKSTVVPCVALGLLGVTAIDVRVALVTFRVAGELTMLANTAVIDAEPGEAPVTKPCRLTALLIVATDAGEEAQVTSVVKFCVLESANVPVAVSGSETPSGTLAGDGLTAMETKGEDVTITPAWLLGMPR